MSAIKTLWLFLLALLSVTQSYQQNGMSCTYGARGSLTSTCVNANPMYFRTTSYRFDNLDETVRCVNCVLTTIESNTFDISGNQIKALDLNSSQIVTLKPKAFIGLVFLKKLLLPNNKITKVPPETFLGINKVVFLDMQNNEITELVQNGFKELVNLRQLNLRNNHIAKIEAGSFNGLSSLEELDLSKNSIVSLDGIFTGLMNIGLINLESNRIENVSLSSVPELDSLLQMNLAGNNIKKIGSAALLSLLRVEYLNLSSNPLDTLEFAAFRGLYAVETLDLSNCAIKEIQKGVLYSLHHLRNLNLANNKISIFATGAYSGLPELRNLNLSHNKIELYKKTGVFSLRSLHTVDLSYNNLKDLDYKLLVEHMPRLAYIELNNNPWPCYLGKEMEDYFKHDNLVYTLDKEYDDPSVKCTDSRPNTPPKEDPAVEELNPAASTLVVESNGHEYVLYVFICITLGLMAFLFYMEYKTQKDVRSFIGHSNIAEQQLLASSDLNARDDY